MYKHTTRRGCPIGSFFCSMAVVNAVPGLVAFHTRRGWSILYNVNETMMDGELVLKHEARLVYWFYCSIDHQSIAMAGKCGGWGFDACC